MPDHRLRESLVPAGETVPQGLAQPPPGEGTLGPVEQAGRAALPHPSRPWQLSASARP
jgi:hypothetical protein